MAFDLKINGSLSIDVLDLNTGLQVHEDVEKEVLQKLQDCDYFLELATKRIVTYDEIELKVLYDFEFSVNEDTSYDFDEENW